MLRVVDDQTAIFETAIVTDPTFTITLLIEGITTKGMADGQGTNLYRWFKIVDTKKLDDTTYFVAWPIAQNDGKEIPGPPKR